MMISQREGEVITLGRISIRMKEKLTGKPSQIEQYWRDISEYVANDLFQRNLIVTDELAKLTSDQIIKLSGD